MFFLHHLCLFVEIMPIMAGDEDDSGINILKSENIVANPVLKGLGEYEEVAKFFINKIKSKIFV